MADSPFLGIHPYRFSDKDIFFGREDKIDELFAKVLLHRLILVFGESGNGKSSLINAGLIPLLQTEGFAPEKADS